MGQVLARTEKAQSAAADEGNPWPPESGLPTSYRSNTPEPTRTSWFRASAHAPTVYWCVSVFLTNSDREATTTMMQCMSHSRESREGQWKQQFPIDGLSLTTSNSVVLACGIDPASTSTLHHAPGKNDDSVAAKKTIENQTSFEDSILSGRQSLLRTPVSLLYRTETSSRRASSSRSFGCRWHK